jgi:Glycosyl transferase family 2
MAMDEDAAVQLVWNCQSRELCDLPMLGGQSWVAAIQQDMITYYADGYVLANTSRNCRPDFNACVIMMLKDESDIIEANLRWHYAIGFRRFILCDNNSSDESLALLEAFRRYAWNAEIVIVQDPLVRYTQSDKMT